MTTEIERSDIFLSYSWANKEHADRIDGDLVRIGINMIRDIKDAPFKSSLTAFMKRVRETDYVIILLSKAYLESYNCMYEVFELAKDDDYFKRTLPILLPGSDVFNPHTYLGYIHHWEKEYEKLDKELSSGRRSGKEGLVERLSNIDRIRLNIGRFLEKIGEEVAITYEDLLKQNYGPLLKYIKVKDPKPIQELLRINEIEDKENQEIALFKLDKEYPNNESIYNLKGIIAFENIEFKVARFYYKKALEIDPNAPEAHNNLGLLLVEYFKEYDEAKKHYKRAIYYDPKNVKIYCNLGHLLADHFKEYDEAKEFYEKALEIDPACSIAYFGLGNLLQSPDYNRKDFDEYIKDHIKDQNTTRDNSSKYFQTQANNLKSAVKCYKKAIEINPEFANAYNNMGIAIRELGGYVKEMKEYFEEAIRIEPNHSKAHFNLGMLLEDYYNDPKRAREEYEKAIESSSENPVVYSRYGNLLAKHFKEYDKAKIAYERSIEIEPGYIIVYSKLIDLLRDHLNEPKKAQEYIKKIKNL